MVVRLLYFGMSGVLSIAPLEQLLAEKVEIGAVIVPADAAGREAPRRLEPSLPGPSDLPLINPHVAQNIVHLAWAHNIPVWEVENLSDARTLTLLAGLQPDLIVVACFSRIFPPALLALPKYGSLNLHPSLLPAFRGPAPLFWMARQAEAVAGVTLHFLAERVDGGDIVDQTSFAWPEGISGIALEQRCATVGAQLIGRAIQRLEQEGTLPRRLQNETEASYFRWPTTDDFLIPTAWDARRAFNFLRFGQQHWPLWVEAGGKQIFIRVAISYDLHQEIKKPILHHEGEIWVQFNPGVLRVQPTAIF